MSPVFLVSQPIHSRRTAAGFVAVAGKCQGMAEPDWKCSESRFIKPLALPG